MVLEEPNWEKMSYGSQTCQDLCTSSTGGLFGQRKLKFHFHLSPSPGVPDSEFFETDGEICPNTAWLVLHGKVQSMGLHNSGEILVLSLQKYTLMWQKK